MRFFIDFGIELISSPSRSTFNDLGICPIGICSPVGLIVNGASASRLNAIFCSLAFFQSKFFLRLRRSFAFCSCAAVMRMGIGCSTLLS